MDFQANSLEADASLFDGLDFQTKDTQQGEQGVKGVSQKTQENLSVKNNTQQNQNQQQKAESESVDDGNYNTLTEMGMGLFERLGLEYEGEFDNVETVEEFADLVGSIIEESVSGRANQYFFHPEAMELNKFLSEGGTFDEFYRQTRGNENDLYRINDVDIVVGYYMNVKGWNKEQALQKAQKLDDTDGLSERAEEIRDEIIERKRQEEQYEKQHRQQQVKVLQNKIASEIVNNTVLDGLAISNEVKMKMASYLFEDSGNGHTQLNLDLQNNPKANAAIALLGSIFDWDVVKMIKTVGGKFNTQSAEKLFNRLNLPKQKNTASPQQKKGGDSFDWFSDAPGF